MPNLTVLIDGKNSLFRHNFTSKLTDPTGEKISGTFGIVKEVTSVLRIMEPDNLIICWDKGKPRERSILYPEYKANRSLDEETRKNIGYQVQQAKRIFKHLPVKQITVDGVEADDVIGFLTKKLKGDKIIFSNDSDFLQCVNENTKLFLPKTRQEINVDNIDEYLGFDHKYYILHKAIVGDSSDNIKGVKGIGAKTATKIIKKEKKVKLDKDLINLNIKLIKICGLLTKEDQKLILKYYSEEAKKEHKPYVLRKVFKDLGFRSLLLGFNGIINEYKRLR